MNAENTPGISRRDALKTIGAGVVLAGLGGLNASVSAADPAPVPPDAQLSPWELPKLGFAFDALEPHIDAETMEIHYLKHHLTYINNAKKLLEAHPNLAAKGPDYIVRNLSAMPEAIRTGLRNNVGGHVNHTFFWSILAPETGGDPVNTLADAITTQFGSVGQFRKLFTDAAMKRFGSGWAWLTVKEGKLEVTSTANQDSPLTDGATPLVGVDVWEHAYYLHYQNRRSDYLNAFWKVVNWPQIETVYLATLKS